MLKKLSLLLATVTLCTNIGIVAPVSAQTVSEEKVLVQSNFENCNFGTYSAENQKDGETDLRNGVVMGDDSDLTTGYTLKNSNGGYDAISEADIVNDGGTKVLRLNSFFGKKNDTTIQTNSNLPNSGKVKIDLEMKITYPASFYMYHSSSTLGGARRLWRMERASGSEVNIFLQEKITTDVRFGYNQYNKFTVIMDTATAEMSFFKNGEFIKTITGKAPAKPWQLYLVQAPHNDVKPTLTYNAEDSTKIESVTNPQYVYIKSLKMTTYNDIAFESVTPANGSSVMTPTEAVFTFNKPIEKVAKAEVIDTNSNATVDVTSSLVFDGKTVKVPYAFEDEKTYEVKLTGASDGLISIDAATSFKAEAWNFSNLIKNPVNALPVDNNTYFINEDFTNSDNTTLVTEANRHSAWSVVKQDNTSIVELEDGNKALQLASGSDFRVFYEKSLRLLDSPTTLSYDVYLNKDTKQFNVDMQLSPVAMWQYGYYKQSGQADIPGEGPMTAGEWHKVDISISDETGKAIYVDGKLVYTTPKDTVNLKDVYWFRFRANGANVIIDNLKLYLDKSENVLTSVAPAFNETTKASAPLEFTYNEVIGDVSDAKLIVKSNDTNEATVLTNGNGMSVNVENNTVKLVLDNTLNANCGYAVELSGLKDISGAIVSPVRTKFTTVADEQGWIMTEIATEISGPNSKTYSLKLKHPGAEKNAQLIAATYNSDGTLSSIVLSDAKTVGDNWSDFSVKAEYNAGKTTKLFIWDSVNGMKPIINSISK